MSDDGPTSRPSSLRHTHAFTKVAAIQDEARRYSSEYVHANRNTLLEMQSSIGSTRRQRVKDGRGGEYFRGPEFRPETANFPEFAFVVKELSVPANVEDQNKANRGSRLADPKPWTT